jgi:predicted esterase
MVAVSAEYRIKSKYDVTPFDCVEDAKSAIRWVRPNADELGIDPDRIAAGGGSAGGHIAACTGIISGLDDVNEDLSISSAPDAMVLFNPVVNLLRLRNAAKMLRRLPELHGRLAEISPSEHVRANLPPTIILHGAKDTTVHPQDVIEFAAAMTDVGNRCEVRLYEGKGHGFFNYGRDANKSYRATLQAADDFLVSLGYLEPLPVRDGVVRVDEPRKLVGTEIAPSRVVSREDGTVFVDFGKAAFGTVRFTAGSESGEEVVEVHLGEVAAGNSVEREPGGSRRYRKMSVRLKTGRHEYTVAVTSDERNTGPAAIKMPDYAGEVMPFRYCELESLPSKLDKGDIRQVAVHYPFDDNASYFNCSTNVLNDVWDLCKYSIKATSFCGVYVDGDRERIPYEADAYINQLGHYGVDAEYAMARRTHEYLMTHPTWPTEWIMHSVLMAWADYMYTGDDGSLRRWYDDLKAKTLIALAREDGLVSTKTGLVTDDVLRSIHFEGELRDIVDWPHGGILGLKGGYGETDDHEFVAINTVVNAFHYRSLVLMSRIAGAIGKEADAAFYVERAEKVKTSMNDKLVDRAKGIYVDGEGSTHSSLHSNMFPLAFDVVPEEYREGVVEFVKSRGMACSVYGSQYLLEGLYNAGEDDYALSLMTATHDRSWANMIYGMGSTITTEAWDKKWKPNQDWNHAWGAAPANIIPRRLVGVEPSEPGFARVSIKPQPGGLRYISGKVPTMKGPVYVNVRSSKGKSFTLEVVIPAGTTARVYVPRMDSNKLTVTVDGSERRGRVEGEFIVFDEIPGGYHSFIRKAS